MKTSMILLYAAAASILVSIPLTLAFMTFVGGSGDWVDVVKHPGFWVFYGESFLRMFMASFLASVLTLLLVARRLSKGQ